ncbi:MAG: PQQ-binding-like beta-propeller repeat protein [Cellulomonas sp.]
MQRRVDLAPVELLENDELQPQDVSAPVRKTRRWWLAAVPAVAVGLVVGTQQLIDARERAADARIAALPGAVARVGSSLDVVWQTDDAVGGMAWDPVTLGALHGVVVGTDGSLAYEALDTATGTITWSTPLLGPDEALTDPRNTTTTHCEHSGHDRAVCLVADGYQRSSDTGEDEGRAATEAHVVVVDLTDGSVLADRTIAPASSLAVLPDLVATAVVDDRRHLVVVATDPMTGDELWRYRDVDPVRGRVDDQTATISSAGDLIVLFNRPSGPLVLDADGKILEPDESTDSWGTTREGWLTWSRRNPDGPDPLTRVMRPGQLPLDITGDLLTRTVDDGSIPGLELSTGGKTYAWDAGTGTLRWSADVIAERNWGDQVLVLGGRVYLPTADGVVALDGEDGSVLWTTPHSPATMPGELLTDGPHLLLVQSPVDPAGTGDVLVLDRRDGTALRRAPLPEGTWYAFEAGGRLISDDGDGIVGLG